MYIRKTQPFEALQFDGENYEEFEAFYGRELEGTPCPFIWAVKIDGGVRLIDNITFHDNYLEV
jgi:hypothetical protein